MPILPVKMKILLVLAENSWKTKIKFFPLCAIFHMKTQIFCELLSGFYLVFIFTNLVWEKGPIIFMITNVFLRQILNLFFFSDNKNKIDWNLHW